MSDGGSAEQRMQLAQADTGGTGGGSGTLASSAGDKERAAKFLEQHVLPDTRAAGRMGEGGGEVLPPLVAATPLPSVPKPATGLQGLSGWAVDSGLSEAMTAWQGQVNRLVGRLNGEMSALRGTNGLFRGQDTATGVRFGSMDVGRLPYLSLLDQM